jgi:thiol:disulfide interchange protein DsbD
VEITLLSPRSALAPGETVTVAIRQEMAPGWHTYWRNSGDSGDATRISWTLPDGVRAGDIRWPTPKALPFQTLVNYGYENRVVLPVDITVPATARPGQQLRLEAAVSWLECADICIPGDGTVAITLPVAATGADSADAPEIAAAVAALPARLPSMGVIADAGGGWIVAMPDAAFAGATSARFFPHEIPLGALIDYPAPQMLETGPEGLSLAIPKSPSAPQALDGPYGGVLVVGEGAQAEAFEITLNPGPVPAGVQGTRPRAIVEGGIGLVQAALLAFLGGLILNLMPCVFPILAMKALGLAGLAGAQARTARLHGLIYGAGVVLSFLALAGALIGLQAAGAAVGWGFQLQSPPVILLLALLMFAIGLNLLGALEIGGRVQAVGSGLAAQGGAAGAFWTGVLAVIVASPCTAPFMGAALGYAAVAPPVASLAVFAALGIGFAAPFVLVTFVPGILARLPRPGPWMDRLKQALAFPMFATAAWLVWVLAAQAGQDGVLAALAGAVGLGFAAWVWRAGSGAVWRVVAAALVLAILAGGVMLAAGASPARSGGAAAAGGGDSAGPPAQPWSPEAVRTALDSGKAVFVNFTADWCVTCKVNEGAVFTQAEVRAALDGTGAVYLVGDWTLRDEAIASELRRHGRIGVPLYLVYRSGETGPDILPQLLTPGIVLDALD